MLDLADLWQSLARSLAKNVWIYGRIKLLTYACHGGHVGFYVHEVVGTIMRAD